MLNDNQRFCYFCFGIGCTDPFILNDNIDICSINSNNEIIKNLDDSFSLSVLFDASNSNDTPIQSCFVSD